MTTQMIIVCHIGVPLVADPGTTGAVKTAEPA